jgi:hypothetical protein
MHLAGMKALVATFTISPLSRDVTSRIRSAMKDDFGHTLSVRRDSSPHQCRACLRLTEPGEGVVLFSYSPFESDQPYAEVGPIFIHERECRPYGEIEEYPATFPRDAVVLRAYDERDEIEDAAFVGRRPVEQAIARLFENPRVSYLHARNSTYGCFMFRIDRAGTGGARIS